VGGVRPGGGAAPRRGEVFDADLAPVEGHEQGGRRPVLVVSVDPFNAGPSELVAIVPVTRRDRGIASHLRLVAAEGGLTADSVILCDQPRTISRTRLRRRRGAVAPATLTAVEAVLRRFFAL
jgi:mRNA interferase MazF